MRFVLIISLVFLSGCSVSFKSDQFSAIKRMFDSERKELQSEQWFVFFEGKRHEAYAFINENSYRVYSLEYLEIDVVKTHISKITVPTPIRYEINFTPTKIGFDIHHQATNELYKLNCQNLRQASTFVYLQQCYALNHNWQFKNELQVNGQGEIVFIKSFYAPSKPPIELYYGRLLDTLTST